MPFVMRNPSHRPSHTRSPSSISLIRTVTMRVAAHAHGPFLTSVDRTAVRDDDAWNAACLAVAPELIARYCEWVAAQPFASAAEVSAAHAIVAGALRDGAASAAPKPAAKGKGKGKGRGN